MSQEVVQEILKRLGTDPTFRKRMSKEPTATLDKDYPDKLAEAEKAALKEMAQGFAADLKEAERPWWQPTSFKELGGAFLSVVLIALLLWVLGRTYGLIAALPQGVQIGDTVQVVDTFARAKDLLSTMFPLFAAVVTFWLGVAVEGRRADQNQATAEREGQERANAEARERVIKANAAAKMGEAKGHAMALRDAVGAKRTPETAELDALVGILEEGERTVIG